MKKNIRIILCAIVIIIVILNLCGCVKYRVIPAPADYVKPAIDGVSDNYVQPKLNDAQMKEFVFDKRYTRPYTEQEISKIQLDYSNGEIIIGVDYTQLGVERKDQEYFLTRGVTTVKDSDSQNKYSINYDTSPMTESATVKSSFDEQYLDVMFANLTYKEERSVPKDAWNMIRIFNEDSSWSIYSDSRVRYSIDDVHYCSEQSVDFAYLSSLALLDWCKKLENDSFTPAVTRYNNFIDNSARNDYSVEVNYNGNIIVFDKQDFLKFWTKNEVETKREMNRKCVSLSQEYIQVDFKYSNMTETVLALPNGNAIEYFIRYANYGSYYGTVGSAAILCQCTIEYTNAINYDELAALFN